MLYIFVKHLILKETAMTLKETFNNNGLNCQLTDEFDYEGDNLYIIFGSHDIIDKLPKKYIIYQLEQSCVGSYNTNKEFIDNNFKIFNKKYLNILQNALEVWEYSYENIDFFNKLNKRLIPEIKTRYVPICYSSYLSQYKKKKCEKNIDILFFGSMNDRRKKILNELKLKGFKVEIYVNNLYEEERLKKILSSKIILNLHFYEKALLETHRIAYLLSNKSFIISENSRDSFNDNLFKDSVVLCDYDNIINTCEKYLLNDNYRDELSCFGFNFFKKMNYMNYISKELLISETNHKNKKKKIEYYVNNSIEEAEIQKNNDNCVLKLNNITDEELPYVSIITPTGNRRKLFNIAIRNFNNLVYPKEKLEWVILDDGCEDMGDIIPKNNNINYIKLDCKERLPIGKKRNLCVSKAKYDYIVFMDDDDYYTPESLIARIKILLKYNKSCVGCTSVGNYNLVNNQSTLAQDSGNYLCEATMAFKKSFWEERNFNNDDKYAEYKYFQHHRQSQMISLPFQFVMIALTHNNNLSGNTRIYNNFDEWVQKNKEDYKNLIHFFDEDTKIFLNDIINLLNIDNKEIINNI
jgi:hypothetical protein